MPRVEPSSSRRPESCPKCSSQLPMCGPRFQRGEPSILPDGDVDVPEFLKWWCQECQWDTYTPCMDADVESES